MVSGSFTENIGIEVDVYDETESKNLGAVINTGGGSVSNIGLVVNADTAAILNGQTVINGDLVVITFIKSRRSANVTWPGPTVWSTPSSTTEQPLPTRQPDSKPRRQWVV